MKQNNSQGKAHKERWPKRVGGADDGANQGEKSMIMD
jgi:hypothetical protein